MKKLEKGFIKFILGEDYNAYDSFVKKSSIILSVFFLLCGLIFIIFGQQIINFFKNIESLNSLEITGIFFILISLMYYLAGLYNQVSH